VTRAMCVRFALVLAVGVAFCGCHSPVSPTVKTLDLSGNFAGQAVYTTNPRGCPAGWTAVFNASGAMGTLGSSTWHSEHCLLDSTTGSVSGDFALTAQDGSVLKGTFSGSVGAITAPNTPVPMKALLVVTSATGQYDLLAPSLGDLAVTLTFPGSMVVPWSYTSVVTMRLYTK
jgi:hypothetical protein